MEIGSGIINLINLMREIDGEIDVGERLNESIMYISTTVYWLWKMF